MGVTIYRCQIQATIMKNTTDEVFKFIYFKKLPIKKALIKLRVLSDASVFIKWWFNKQPSQKVLIELSPGVCIFYDFITNFLKKTSVLSLVGAKIHCMHFLTFAHLRRIFIFHNSNSF